MQASRYERTLTELDHLRLERLARDEIDLLASAESDAIDAVLQEAELVASRKVSPDVVTMYSQVLVADRATGGTRELTLCYPADADARAGFISVFSPVGAALLGLHVGSVARWRSPDGQEGAAHVVALLFQPEASGDFSR